MAPVDENFCEYCALIDFDLLQPPSRSELLDLQTSAERRPSSPSPPWPTWSLGLQSRIDESSSSCPLCHAICELLQQNPHIRDRWEHDGTALRSPVCVAGIEQAGSLQLPRGSLRDSICLAGVSLYWQDQSEQNIRPGAVENSSDDPNIPRLIECFRPCTPGVLHRPPPKDVFNDEGNLPEDLAFGGRPRPDILDPGLPAQWLSNCLENHGDACRPDGTVGGTDSYGNRQMSVFRLIDVTAKAVKEFYDVKLSSLKYAALSYVWGGPQPVTLQRATVNDMQQPGSLSSDLIPHTIRDAMAFAASLGVFYIWIDAICIIQDDDEDKEIQLGNTSNVYRYALFTVAVADGLSVNAGLPGVRVPRVSRQIEVPLPNIGKGPPKSLLTTLTPRQEMYLPVTDQCMWSTRAWTLQEHALSGRVIVFMDQQIFWHCSQARLSEETHSESSLGKPSWLSMQDVSMLNTFDRHTDLWRTLQVLIRNFFMRNLTRPGDALDAFSGILDEMERRTGETFLWGIRTSDFEHGLGWLPFSPYPPARRSCLTSRKVTSLKRQVSFPSWSWLGWGGHHIPREYDQGVNKKFTPDIVCFVLRNSPLRLERVSSLEGPRGQASLSLDDVAASDPALSLPNLQNVPDDQYLCFWAECLSFEDTEAVKLDDVSEVPAGTKFFTSRNATFMISELYKPDEKSDYSMLLNVLGPPPERGSRIITDASSHAVIGHIEPCQWRVDSGSVELVLMAYKHQSQTTHAIILEVERRDGVTTRQSIGQIEKQEWARCQPITKVVVLN